MSNAQSGSQRPQPARPSPSGDRADAAAQPLDSVAAALERLRYGVIQLTVHDGRLVQLDVTERTRFA